MLLHDRETRSLVFYEMNTTHNMKQKEIINYFKEKNGESFSQSTISAGIREGRILSKIEELEIAYQQISNELNRELKVNIMINPCISTNGIRKYKK